MAIQIIPNYRRAHEGILQEPDKRLRKVSVSVNRINKTVTSVANQLISTLKKIDKSYLPWLGMAAPQIGYDIRIIVIKKGNNEYQVMINPQLIEQKWLLPTISGCFSLKGLYLFKSPYWVKVKYLDLKGKSRTEVFQGGMAVLLKQEIDHLNGKLVSD